MKERFKEIYPVVIAALIAFIGGALYGNQVAFDAGAIGLALCMAIVVVGV